jgi:glycosyltransferase involved in cell wall biosynthesis
MRRGSPRYVVAVANSLRIRLLMALAPRIAFAYLILVALIERGRTAWRRRRRKRPRLIWGPVPIISLKYWSEAMRAAGYESRTCVTHHYSVHTRRDFDVYLDRFTGESPLSKQLAPYRFYAWALRHGDIFLRFFDGGFLRYTPYEWEELRILRLAGKRLIVSPYGSDVAVSGHLGDLEEALYADYPVLRGMSAEIEHRVRHTASSADVVVRNWQLGFVPRRDVIWLSQLAIDLDHWTTGQDSGHDGSDGAVTVIHAPNHREIKGTKHLERAVKELRDEGLQIDLVLLEGRPNEEVRAEMMGSDVVADQFLLQGYAMAAVEAMAAGKPVMVNMSALPGELKATEAFEECPAVDTNPENLEDRLRELVRSPSRRRELGGAGRRYVERFHSYEAVAEEWRVVIDHAWRGTPLPPSLPPPRR